MNLIFYGDVQPNHKEHLIWIDSKGVIKTYNNEEAKWVELTSGSNSSDDQNTITFTWKKAITSGGLGGNDLQIDGYEDYVFTVKEGTTFGEFIFSEQGQVTDAGAIVDNQINSPYQIVVVGDDFLTSEYRLSIRNQAGNTPDMYFPIENGEVFKPVL